MSGAPPSDPAPLSDVQAIARAADELASALDQAGREAAEGALIELTGLERQVAALCGAAEALPAGEARALLGRLGDLVAALDPLAAVLADQHARRAEALQAALSGRDDPHTARRRAVAAYGRPSGAPSPGPSGDAS